jgi:hypothetical protein
MLGDYEQVDGIYFPFSIETAETGTDNWQRLTVEKIELNVPLDDSLFSIPSTKAPAKSAAVTCGSQQISGACGRSPGLSQ